MALPQDSSGRKMGTSQLVRNSRQLQTAMPSPSEH
jgi:hypothetical protein